MKPGYAEMTASEAASYYKKAAEAAQENYNEWEDASVKSLTEDIVYYGFMWRKKRKRGLDEAKKVFEEDWKLERKILKQGHEKLYYRAEVYGSLDPASKVSIPFPIGAK